MFPTLETDRLILRPPDADDAAAMAEIYADPEMTRFLGDGKPLDRVGAWRALAAGVGHWHLRGYGFWTLVEKSSGAMVGRAGLFDPDGWPGLELGWHVRRSAWGRGFAPEAARAAMTWAFTDLDAPRLLSVIHPDNAASIRVAEKLGMRYLRDQLVGGHTVGIYGIDRPA